MTKRAMRSATLPRGKLRRVKGNFPFVKCKRFGPARLLELHFARTGPTLADRIQVGE